MGNDLSALTTDSEYRNFAIKCSNKAFAEKIVKSTAPGGACYNARRMEMKAKIDCGHPFIHFSAKQEALCLDSTMKAYGWKLSAFFELEGLSTYVDKNTK